MLQITHLQESGRTLHKLSIAETVRLSAPNPSRVATASSVLIVCSSSAASDVSVAASGGPSFHEYLADKLAAALAFTTTSVATRFRSNGLIETVALIAVPSFTLHVTSGTRAQLCDTRNLTRQLTECWRSP